jgi:hypothetical protein
MTGWDLVGLLVVLAVLVLLLVPWLVWTAGRLDRQHLRLEAARATLEAQLARRAALATEVAASGSLDPASALLVLDAAAHVQSVDADGRWQAESELTEVLLGAGVPADDADPSSVELRNASRRVAMARRIHNDLATAADGLHARRRVRWFRLAGHATTPELIEFDDRPLP